MQKVPAMAKYKTSAPVQIFTEGENGDLDVGDLLKSISCIVGACNASELPFVFNKALKLDGSSVRPGSKDKAMMQPDSRCSLLYSTCRCVINF